MVDDLEPIFMMSDDRLMTATIIENDQQMFVVKFVDIIHNYEVVKKYNVFEVAEERAKQWVGIA